MSEIFHDRAEAGAKLARELQKTKRNNPLILALPRGGVEVAAEVARVYHEPVDLLFVRKLGAEFNPELGIGAIVEGSPPQVFLNEDLVKILKVTRDYIEKEKFRQTQVMLDQQKLYRAGRERPSAKDREVILIDDGIATGATVQAALKGVKSEKPKKLTLAVPVCPPSTIEELRAHVDEVVCLLAPASFQAVGQFYRHFPRVEDSRVIQIVKTKF